MVCCVLRGTQGISCIPLTFCDFQVQITLFVPNGAIRCATGSIVQNTEIAYLAGMVYRYRARY